MSIARSDVDDIIQEYAELEPEYTIIHTFVDEVEGEIGDIFVVSTTEDEGLINVVDIIVMSDPAEVNNIVFTDDELTKLAVFWLKRKGYAVTAPLAE